MPLLPSLESEYSLYRITNPLFGLQVDDETVPLGQFINDVIDKGLGAIGDKVKEHAFASFTNSFMTHKGDVDAIQDFLNAASSEKAWNLAQIAGEDFGNPVDKRLMDDFGVFNMHLNDTHLSVPATKRGHDMMKDIKKTRDALNDYQSQGYGWYDEDTAFMNRSNDVGFRFRSAMDTTTNTMYISFPPLGADELEKAVSGSGKDALYRSTEFPYRKGGGFVSEPFMDMYASHRPNIQKLLQESGAKNVYFTGHSLGGGVAHLAANDDLWDGLHVQVTTFGAPAVGDADFVKSYRPNVNVNRVMNSSDPVSTFGFMFHPTQEVWDIAPKGENMFANASSGKKGVIAGVYNIVTPVMERVDSVLGLERVSNPKMDFDFEDLLTKTHRSNGIDASINGIKSGDIDLGVRKAGGMVSYPRFRAFKELVQTKTVDKLLNAMVITKALVKDSGMGVLEDLKSFKLPIIQETMRASKSAITKAGGVFGEGGAFKIVKNAMTDTFHFDSALLKRFSRDANYTDQVVKISDDYFKKTGENILDVNGNAYDDVFAKSIDFDDLYTDIEMGDIERRVDTDSMDFNKVRRELLDFGDDMNRLHNVPSWTPVNRPSGRQVFGKSIVNETAQTITDTTSKMSSKVRLKLQELFKKTAADTPLPSAPTSKVMPAFEPTSKVLPIFDPPKSFAQKAFTNIKPTVLNTPVGKGMISVGGSVSDASRKLFKKITGGKGFSGITKNYLEILAKSGVVGDTVGVAARTGKEFLEKLGKKAPVYFRKSAKLLKKMAKYVAKAMPVIGIGLEVYFTIDEIDNDLTAIEEEKIYTVWNGEIIFKLYNPEEYHQLTMFQLIYSTLDLPVTFDEFANEWYGRLSSREDGVLMIDGIATDTPDFDVVYQKSLIDVGEASYEGDSKTLSVVKNIGLGVFNLALDLVTGTTGSLVTGVTVGVIDEVFEQQAINKKSNGFNRALNYKILEDSIRETSDFIMDSSLPIYNYLSESNAKKLIMRYLELSLKDPDTLTPSEKTDKNRSRIVLANSEFDVELMDANVIKLQNMRHMLETEPEILHQILDNVYSIGMTPGSFGAILIGEMMNEVLATESVVSNLNEFVNMQAFMRSVGDIADDIFAKVNAGNPLYPHSFVETAYDIIQQASKMYIELDDSLSAAETRFLARVIYENASFDLRMMDMSVNRNSIYKDDEDIKQAYEKYGSEQYAIQLTRGQENNAVLESLMKKHSGVDGTRDLQKEMDDAILDTHIAYILQVSGNEGDDQLARFLKKRYDNMKKPGEKPSSGVGSDEDYIFFAKYGITRDDIDMMASERDTDVTLALENTVKEQYLFITRIIDVFHDPRSIYKKDEDVIAFFKSQGININVNERTQERFDAQGEAYQGAIDDQNEHFKDVLDDQNEQFNDAWGEMTATYQDRFNLQVEEFNALMKKVVDDANAYVKTSTGEVTDYYNAKFAEMIAYIEEMEASGVPTGDGSIFDSSLSLKQKIGLMNDPVQDEGATNDLNMDPTNDVIDERGQMDRGYADKGEDYKSEFTRTGKILPFTIDNGVITVLFEDGTETSYTGAKNALVGSVSVGYWVGPVPRGDHAPINTIDNFYMAFHIEHQTDPLIARLRFMARISKAINDKVISPSNGMIEYNLAVSTLAYITENKDIYGIDVSSILMNNGLGADLNVQLHERISKPRKGVLPDNIDFTRHDISLEQTVENPLKRAADLAFMIGDDLMGRKFRKISIERDDMSRVAGEYLESIRQQMDPNGAKNINPLQRLVLEESVQQEGITEQYTKLLLESLGKQLFEFL